MRLGAGRRQSRGVAPHLWGEVDDATYPVTRVIALAFRIDRADFISHQVWDVPRPLGFDVRYVEPERPGRNEDAATE